MSVSNSRAWLWRGIDALIFTAGIVSACISLFFYDSPLPAVPLFAAGCAWAFYRWAKLNRWGVLIWFAAVFFLAVAWEQNLSLSARELEEIFHPLCGFLLLADLVLFFLLALKDARERGPHVGGITLVFFTIIAGGTVFSSLGSQFWLQREIQETTNTLITLHQLAGEVEAIRARIGRLPGSEGELVELRGKPMPTYYLNYCIHYYRSSPEDYSLSACVNNFWGADWDIFGYILHCYGPTSPRRVRAELF